MAPLQSKLNVICALFLALAFSSFSFGQKPKSISRYSDEKYISEFLENAVITYAITNTQQEGNFYFLPFSPKFETVGFYNINPSLNDRAGEAQLVLKVLAKFEQTKNVEVVSFQLIRDQQGAYGIRPTFHGIFLKAKPVPKTETGGKHVQR